MMAKPKRNKNGIFTLGISYNYQRKKLTLGAVEQVEADYFAANVDLLASCRKLGTPLPESLVAWLATISPHHREKLAGVGLISQYETAITVADLMREFLAEYAQRDTIKTATITSMSNALTHRFPKFLKDKTLSELEPHRDPAKPLSKPVFTTSQKGFMVKVVSWQREHYALSSWSRANGRIREMGKWAVEQGICKFNPFVLLPKPEQVNDDRNEYVERSWALDVMANCLDPDTRLSIACGRFSGMRTPSECRRMKPEHIDLESGELTIIGKGKNRPKRRMPLFSVFRQELERHRDEVGGWGRHVFTDRFMGKADANNFNLILEAVNRAGLDAWNRLRQNLRSSFENDLLEAGFEEREVVTWLGHTVRTSRKSYQKQTTKRLRLAAKIASNLGI